MRIVRLSKVCRRIDLLRSLEDLRTEANDVEMRATVDAVGRAIETLLLEWEVIEWEVKVGIDWMLGQMPSEEE